MYCSTLNFVSAPAENASLPAKWFASVVKALRPTVENNKSGYCWPYCNASDGKCLVTFSKMWQVIPYLVTNTVFGKKANDAISVECPFHFMLLCSVCWFTICAR